MYTVTVTDVNGCVLSDSALVTEPSQLVLSTTSSPAYCQLATGSASVTASGGTGSYTYVWQPGGQTTSSISNIFPGSYTVQVTDANNCSQSATVVIANTPGVVASVTNVVPPLCSASCDGSALAVATGGVAPFTYAWNTSPAQSNATAGNLCAGIYSVTITDAAGCPSTASVALTAPPALLLSAGTVPVLCIGQSATMTATASGGTPAYTYSWSPSGPLVSPTTTTTYTVVVTDGNGCQAAPQQVTVQVNPALAVSLSGTALVCMNSLETLLASATGGNGGPYSYSWQPVTGTGNTCVDYPSANTVYTVTLTDGCTTLPATATFAVTVPALPVASFTTADTTGCGQVCADFVNTTPNTQSAYWSFSDGFTTTTQNPTHCFTPGTFDATLIITDNNGCRDTIIHPGLLTVYSNPVADFTLGPQPTTILEPNICFTDHSTPDVVSWYWNFDDPNDQTTSTIQNPCHAYSDTGRYCTSLIVTNQHGCWSTSMNCLYISPYFTLYVPNAFTPNDDGLNDLFIPVGNDVDPDNYELMIFDRWGNLIFRTTTWGDGWNGTVKNGSKIAQIDAYVWKINLKDHAGQRHQLVGHVSLIK
jgi:gliding motility-associated-like protein